MAMVASLKRTWLLLTLSVPYAYWLWGNAPDPAIAARAFACLLAAIVLPISSQCVSRFNRLLLLLLAWPWESFYAVSGDQYLQQSTATTAAWLVNHIARVPVTITTYNGMPTLSTDQLHVAISSQCAGLLPFLAFIGLGLVLAELYLSTSPVIQWRFIVISPVLGWSANVVRIAVSTGVAYALYQQGYRQHWELWHDLIGYATFVMVYACLFAIARWRMRQTTTLPTTPIHLG